MYADDTPPVASSSTATIPAKRPHPSNVTASAPPNCRCSPPEQSLLRTVVKEGPNKGRQFWTCPQPDREQRCQFFAWADEEGLNGNDASRSVGMSRTGSGYATNSQMTSGDCFKCGQPGHWSSACPNNEGPGFGGSRSKSFGSSTFGTASVGTCYKCHEPGHFAPDCPNANGGRAVKSKGATGDSEEGCFKCGGSGHWAKDCPGDKGSGRSSSFSGTGSRGLRINKVQERGRGGKKKSAFGAADGR
ncbi:hypothetical protein BDQ17DRAFT_1346931 [Cyathus striatus]|nr:hypothetical protein BDQ17DRAFT_1346931 [Cyathus striatus]